MHPSSNDEDDDQANQAKGRVTRKNSISSKNVSKSLRRAYNNDDIMNVQQPANKPIEVDDNTPDDGGALESGTHFREKQHTTSKTSEIFTKPFMNINIEEYNKNLDVSSAVDNTKSINWYVGDGDSEDVLDEPLTHNVEGETEILDPDPMDLLELDQRSGNEMDERDTEELDDESDSDPSTTYSMRNINDWMEQYLWLLYEDADEYYGYCLYCDMKLSVRSYSSVKQHALSLYHKERTDNYLAFREEEEKSGLSTPLIEIKQEFGTDSRTRALKLKRKTQVEALNNFNWRRWLKQHGWLERNNDNDNSEGTIGFCKYCRITLNVEFSYLRERHEASTKHKDAEKVYKTNNNKVNRTSEQSDCNDYAVEDGNGDGNDDSDSEASNKSRVKELQLREVLENDPRSCRCLACNIVLYKCNFRRHAGTITHKVNSQNYYKKDEKPSHSNNNNNNRVSVESTSPVKEEKVEDRRSNNSSQTKPNWHIYAKQHPWLTAYSKDDSFAYCLYCDRRLQYGTSDIKRRIHENSIQHKQAEITYKKKYAKNNILNKNHDKADGDEGENESVDGNLNGNDNVNDNKDKIYSKNAPEKYNKKHKNRSHNMAEWLKQYVWCRPYKSVPDKFYYCIYCKMALSRKRGRSKHEMCRRHLKAEQKYLRKGTNGGNEDEMACTSSKSQSLSLTSLLYPWAVHFSNAPSTYYCKYCKMRLSTSYKKDKHQKSKNHRANEEIWKSKYAKTDGSVNANGKNDKSNLPSDAAANAKSSLGKRPPLEIMIKLWRIKFPWLMLKRDEVRPFYAFCKLCQKSIFVRTSKNASRHQKSGPHIRQWNLKRNQVLQQQQRKKEGKQRHKNTVQVNDLANVNDTEQQQSHNQEHNDTQDQRLATLKKRFVWIETSTIPNYVYCRQCDAHVLCRFIQIKNHHYSEGHRKIKSPCPSMDDNVSNVDRHEPYEENTSVHHNNNVADVYLRDTVRHDETMNGREVSNNDENSSHDMSDHHEYVNERGAFRRKLNYSDNMDDVKQRENQSNQSKRFKRSQNDSEFYDGRQVMTDILNAPLTLANCLGPLIQQQIQQTTSNIAQTLNQSSSEKFPIHESPPAEHSYDLFFRSVSETMKKLPQAVAAAGKVKIMQIMCELELQALNTFNRNGTVENAITESGGIHNITTQANTNVNVNANAATTTIFDSFPINNAEKSSNESAARQIDEMEMPTTTPSPTSTSSTKILPSVIGVMDKEGLHSIYVERTIPPDQIANLGLSLNESVSTTTMANAGTARPSTTKIRCIPIKSLTNTNITLQSNKNNIDNNISAISASGSARTQVTGVLTDQLYNVNTNTLANLNPNSVLNYRNVQISKKTTTPSQGVSIQHAPTYIRPPRNIPVNTLNASFISSPLLSSTLSTSSTSTSTSTPPATMPTSVPTSPSSSLKQN